MFVKCKIIQYIQVLKEADPRFQEWYVTFLLTIMREADTAAALTSHLLVITH